MRDYSWRMKERSVCVDNSGMMDLIVWKPTGVMDSLGSLSCCSRFCHRIQSHNFPMYLIDRVIIILPNFIKSFFNDLINLILLGGLELHGRMNHKTVFMSIFDDLLELFLGLLDCIICLHFADVRVVGDLVHSLEDTVH